MKYYILTCFAGFFLSSCITEYNAKGIDEVKDILVVEGIITEGETVITLNRSINLTDDQLAIYQRVNNAFVYIECDDGTQFPATPPTNISGQYRISNGKLNPEKQYRLMIGLEGLAYSSPYTYPIVTPEIDSVFWTKNAQRQPVRIHVATHDPQNRVLYYRWSYFEEWEIISDIQTFPPYEYPYQCWNNYKSTELLLGSNEKTVFGQVTDILTEFSPTNRKLEVMYRITVKQNAISKRAFDYLENIKKNAMQAGDIFAPTPSELRGNIYCTTEPDRPVIGYVDVSTTMEKRIYIKPMERAYEPAQRPWMYPCSEPFELGELEAMYDPIPIPFEIWKPIYSFTGTVYVMTYCVDCTNFGNTVRPDDWPDY